MVRKEISSQEGTKLKRKKKSFLIKTKTIYQGRRKDSFTDWLWKIKVDTFLFLLQLQRDYQKRLILFMEQICICLFKNSFKPPYSVHLYFIEFSYKNYHILFYPFWKLCFSIPLSIIHKVMYAYFKIGKILKLANLHLNGM